MIRVFPAVNNLTPDDDLVRFREPGLFDPRDVPVRVSCTFSWDKPRAEWLADLWSRFSSDIELGGPAYGDPGGEFTPGMYVKKGVVVTSRGCPKVCDFCLVPSREGHIRELKVTDGWNVIDNNLLACSEPHLDKVFEMLKRQKEPIKFSGGLDASLLRSDHLVRFAGIKLGELWFACDSDTSIEPLRAVGKMLDEAEIPLRQRRAYVLFDPERDTLEKAEQRALAVMTAGFGPFAQIKRPDDAKTRMVASKEWRQLAKVYCRPAAFGNRMRKLYAESR